MAMSTDADLIEYQPDILNYGIDEFTDYHTKAREDILRRLRNVWWDRAKSYNSTAGTSYLEMDADRLTESQFTRCAVYRVLSEYALPQLTKWNATGDEDKFQVMMNHYAKKYDEEFNAILLDGVDYDYDGDGTVQDDERETIDAVRLTR